MRRVFVISVMVVIATTLAQSAGLAQDPPVIVEKRIPQGESYYWAGATTYLGRLFLNSGTGGWDFGGRGPFVQGRGYSVGAGFDLCWDYGSGDGFVESYPVGHIDPARKAVGAAAYLDVFVSTRLGHRDGVELGLGASNIGAEDWAPTYFVGYGYESFFVRWHRFDRVNGLSVGLRSGG
jgi:hypothetical protein